MSYGVDVTAYGATGDGQADDTAAFAAALATGQTVHAGKPSAYWKVSSLDFPNDGHLICDAGAIIQAASTATPIISTTAFRRGARIEGGMWRSCSHVWKHASTSSLSRATFSSMRIEGCTVAAFEAQTAVSCQWERIDTGIGTANAQIWKLGTTGTANAINNNHLVRCRVLKCTGYAVEIGGNGRPCRGNRIEGCWFEDGDSAAIVTHEDVESLVIERCFFESNGLVNDDPDIIIEGGTIATTTEASVEIASSHWSGQGASNATSRVLVSGESWLTAVRNTDGGASAFVAYTVAANVDKIRVRETLLRGGGVEVQPPLPAGPAVAGRIRLQVSV